MDLLNQNQKPEQSKGKKTVLILLIISIVLFILTIMGIVYLEANKVIEPILYINGVGQESTEVLMITDTNNNKYISLKGLAEILGYNYYKSVYGSTGEETDKCYIQNESLISGFESDSNSIYKYEEDTNLDYQYYELNYNILTYNDKLYIALEDLTLALNISCSIDVNNNIILNSIEYLSEVYQEELKESGYTLATDKNNQKALAYGWIVAGKDNMWGVLDTNFEEIIGNKYSSLFFDEFNLNYIVSDSTSKYGVVTSIGMPELELIYDGLEILNYEYMLYKVKNDEKYGILKTDGNKLTEIIYDDIGFGADATNKIIYTLIIPAIYEDVAETIVVKQNEKYGLIYLETGKEFLPCDHLEKLYAIYDLGETQYKVEVEEITLDLTEYLELRETQEANLN